MTVCGVSGMLPTSACRHDANGYELITDYYLSGTEPTQSCNMHRVVSTSSNVYGVIYIPPGHPLRQDRDLSVVRQYFRGASTDESVFQ